MSKLDTYEAVTAAIVAQLEAGTKPWKMEWQTGGAGGAMPLRHNGQQYRGINVLILWAAAAQAGYRSATWMTFKQAIELGGAVRKGEKGTHIVFFKPLTIKEKNAAGEVEDKEIRMIKTYCVFNVDQIEGLPERFAPAPVEVVAGLERDQAAEAALRSCGAEIREGGDRAFYAPGPDVVVMPDLHRFTNAGAYLATLAHELCHWTGHASRLGRELLNKFGSKDYAFEELVAEIGAAFVGSRLGIVGDHIDNHAAYLASWLKALKNDKRMIFRAASLAQAAADLVLAQAGAGELEDVVQVARAA